jgi:hypothetical protein
VGDRAAVGVGVDQQHLAGERGRLEGEVDRHGGAARPPVGPQTAIRVRRPSASGGARGSRRSTGWSPAAGSATRAALASPTRAAGGSASEPTCPRPSWRRRRSPSSSPAGATPTTARPAAAILASASRSSQRVAAPIRATLACPPAAIASRSPRS